METWKAVAGFEGFYEVSDLGRVRSVGRVITTKNGVKRTVHQRILRPGTDKDGYFQVVLCKDGINRVMTVHRLVGIAFVNNPEKKEQINHLDESKQNNKATNLEWATHKENANYGTAIQRRVEHTDFNALALKYCKKVAQYTLDGKIINLWGSAAEIGRENGYCRGFITACCLGYKKTAYGFRWAYVL
jgi:hypothetical protein